MTTATPPASTPLRGKSLRPAFALLALAVLTVHYVAGPSTTLGDITYDALMVGAAAAILLRVALNREHRAAWGLIGAGVAFWAVGDIYYNAVLLGDPDPPYPSPSDGLYFAMYVALLLGLRRLRGRGRGESLLASGIVVSMLGLATLWSIFALGDVIGSATGSAAAVATTVAYPLLDLALMLSTLLLAASHNWRFDRVLATLALGFVVLATADSLYAQQIAAGSYTWGSFIDTLWPTAAVLIAAAGWLAPRPGEPRVEPLAVLPVVAMISMVIAAAVLAFDHWERLDTITVALATLTLVVACAQLLLLHRERGEARSAARAAEALRSASTEAALDCVISVEPDGTVRDWNPAAAEAFGYTREDAVGRELGDLTVPDSTRPLYEEILADLGSSGESALLGRRLEVLANDARGREFPVELAFTRVQDDPPVFTIFARDISDRRRREEENERLATIVRASEDAMISTDLDGVITSWNQGAERLYGYPTEEAMGQPLTPLIVPTDRVDELYELREQVRRGETAAVDTQRQHRNGRRIDVALRIVPLRNLAGEIVGVSSTSHDITERRMREERERRDVEGSMWRQRIETALAEGGLSFWGQPVVDSLTGRVDHHELLLRMELGGKTIPPGAFLPHAESCDLITEIDRRAIRAGVRIARSRPVAINLSARSLGDARVLDEIKQALDENDVADSVTFEITETAAAENLRAAGELVAELRRLGVGVALDDFGTGYGSFTYLKHLPVTELKIDIEFIRDLVDDTQDQNVVRSIVAVAKNFEMRTVAEGVEDERTLQLLRALDVDLVQGYHLGRPAPLDMPAGAHPSGVARSGARAASGASLTRRA